MPSEKAIIANTLRNIEEVANVSLLLREEGNRSVLTVLPKVRYVADIPAGFEAGGVVLSSDFDKQLTQLGMLYAFADALANAWSETKESK